MLCFQVHAVLAWLAGLAGAARVPCRRDGARALDSQPDVPLCIGTTGSVMLSCRCRSIGAATHWPSARSSNTRATEQSTHVPRSHGLRTAAQHGPNRAIGLRYGSQDATPPIYQVQPRHPIVQTRMQHGCSSGDHHRLRSQPSCIAGPVHRRTSDQFTVQCKPGWRPAEKTTKRPPATNRNSTVQSGPMAAVRGVCRCDAIRSRLSLDHGSLLRPNPQKRDPLPAMTSRCRRGSRSCESDQKRKQWP
jgi:hypothetical protein